MQSNNLKGVLVVLGILTLILAGTSGVLYKQVRKLKVNPTEIAQAENQKIIDMVGKLFTLPEGEAPTIATVTDPDKFKSEQAFFVKAEDGDKVLIYTRALKAIMYRPSTNKIIEVAPLVIGNPTTPGTPAAPATPATP